MIADGSNGRDTHLLLVDLGNTRVGLAPWTNGKRGESRHLPTRPIEPVLEAMREIWTSLPAGDKRVVVSSVCPPVLEELRKGCKAAGVGPLLTIGEDLDLPIEADLPDPDKVGTDRLCTAAAAFAGCRSACVVADFGTALTIDLVADNGIFLGGTILPGIALSARALHEHTALLPLVEVGTPTETLGKDTVSAIRNGIFAMMAGALREIVEQYATEIGKWPPLILTGGDAAGIAARCDFVDRVVPDLALDGVALAYQLHAKRDRE